MLLGEVAGGHDLAAQGAQGTGGFGDGLHDLVFAD
jgi:hypothetical protein